MKLQLINTEKAAGLPETMKPPPLGGGIQVIFAQRKRLRKQCFVNG